jgi:hypothetical protein
MVVIEPEPEPEPEETTRPESPVRGEQSAAAAGREAAPLPPPAPEEQVAADASGDGSREEEEEAFEDALTDEQLQEVVPGAPKPPPRPCYLSPLRLPIGVLESGVQLLGAGIRTLLLNNYLLFEVEWTSRGLAHWYPHSVELILVLVVMNPFNFPCLL